MNPPEKQPSGVQVGPRDTLEADTLSYISLLPVHTNETFGFPRRDAVRFLLFSQVRHSTLFGTRGSRMETPEGHVLESEPMVIPGPKEATNDGASR